MKSVTICWFLVLTISACSLAQTIVTNKIGRAEAVKVVSALAKGTQHKDAVKVLESKGLKGEGGGPCLHGTWFRCYTLAGGDYLAVGYVPQLPRSNDFRLLLAESRLSEAYINDSNGIRVLVITLTNAP